MKKQYFYSNIRNQSYDIVHVSKVVSTLLSAFFILLILVPAFAADLSELNFIDANPIDIVKTISETCGYDLIVGSSANSLPQKKITLNIKDTDGLEIIGQVLRLAGYKYIIEENTILISSLAGDMSSSALEHGEMIIMLDHVFSDNIIPILNKIFPKVLVSPGTCSDILVLKADKDLLLKAGKVIKEIDKPVAKILIEGKVIEVSESGMNEIGLKWGKDVGRFKFVIDKDGGDAGLSEDIILMLNDLATQGKAEILAEPSVLAMDGTEASINIGSRIPYAVPASINSTTVQWTVQYIDAGVSLKIIPKISGNGNINVFFKPEVSSISEWRSTSAGEFPVITTRNAESQINVKDGETIIIGGLINKSERENITKIAVLGDIPLLGLIFQNKIQEQAKTEVIFLITPRIIK